MAPWKFQTASQRWLSSVGYVRGRGESIPHLSHTSNNPFIGSSQRQGKNQSSRPLQQKPEKYWSKEQPQVETTTRYDPLSKNSFTSARTKIFDATTSAHSGQASVLAIRTAAADAEHLHLVSRQLSTDISNTAVFIASSPREYRSVAVERWPEHRATFKPFLTLGQLFANHSVRRSSLGSVGVQAQRGYAANNISGEVLPEGAPPSRQRLRRVAWAPDLPLQLENRFRGEDQISQAICAIWDYKRQSRKRYQSKVQLRDRLASTVFTDYVLTIIGSSASGYGFDESDVDMCMQFKNNFLPIRCETREVLNVLRHRLSGEQGVHRVTLIPALVPIIQFQYKRQPNRSHPWIRVELNLENHVGIVNTQLLYAYSKTDCRVSPFMLACKRWATNMQIKSAVHGTLSSYALTLLMLYFLQVQGVVPVLHHEVPEFAEGRGFAHGTHLLLPPWRSQNTLTVGSLFKEMLNFYADFDFENQCVSVRDGTAISKADAMARDPDSAFLNKNGNSTSSRVWWNYMLVQEPFNFTNVARAVYEKRRLDEITRAIERSRQVIDRPGGPKVLLS